MRKLFSGALLSFIFVVLFAVPASAHAQLESSDPANNAALTTSPTQVVVNFGENVEIPLGSLEVYNANKVRVDSGTPHHNNGDDHSVAVAVSALPSGSYVATWRVISADSHPVHGAFTFTVGNANGQSTSGLASQLLSQGSGPTDVGVAYAIFRALLVGGITVLIGGLTTALFLARGNAPADRLRKLVAASTLVVALSTLGVFLLQGIYAATFGFSKLFNSHVINAVFHTNLGYASVVRFVLTVVLLILLPTVGLKQTWSRRIVYGVITAGLILSLTLSGHAATGRWIPLAIAADLVHVASASAWAGALIIIALVWRAQGEDDRFTLVHRFSALALISVALLTVTGTFQGYRQLDSWNALFHTSYGQILIVKVVLVAIMVLLGRFARNHLVNIGSVIRSIRIEAALAVFVFVATALLMDATPGAEAESKPFTAEAKAGNTLVDIIITPDRAGTNSVHFYTLSTEGVQVDVPEVDASLTLVSKGIGPIPIALIKVAPGHYASYSFNVPISGKWQLDATVRTSDIDEESTTFNVPFN